MRKHVLLAVVATLTLAACASSLPRVIEESATERYQNYAGQPVDRFTAFNITGWTALSRDKLVIWTGVNDAWLLTVWSNCQDLQFAERIRLKRTGASVTRSDRVLERTTRARLIRSGSVRCHSARRGST